MTKSNDTSKDTSSDTGSDEMLARITELARQAMAAQASFARQSLELGRATLSPDVDATAAGRAWVEAVAREGAHYWKEVGALGLDVAGNLVAIGSRSLAKVINDTQAASRTRPAQPSSGADADAALGVVVADDDERDVTVGADTGEQRTSVTLRGAAGDTVTGTITLSNTHARARRVLLSPGRLQPDTGRHVSLDLLVDPEGVTIPAATEHDVQLEVHLAPEVVRPGERYTGIIEVTGGVETVLDVVVVVEG
ncbi:hypothetical protein ACFQU3_11185 [Terrabacter sp. GCM10028922]|uniref:hypothetical protein n=1 Tax=Terrabacter sp. GCM10028922 TaxID=3273428 RepID=UPI00361065C1